MIATTIRPGQRVRHRPTGRVGVVLDPLSRPEHASAKARIEFAATVGGINTGGLRYWLPLAELEAVDNE